MCKRLKCESHICNFIYSSFFFQICHQLVMNFLGNEDVLMSLNLEKMSIGF